MILKDGTEVSTDTATWKYGNDPMAEYLHHLSMNAGADYSFGDADAPCGWVDVFGRRVLRGDSAGNVWVEKYTAAEVQSVVDALEREWSDYLNDATCNVCDTDYSSEDGACWCCGSRSAREKGTAVDEDTLTDAERRERERVMAHGL